MDCEPEELQFLGVVGIYREAGKLLHAWRGSSPRSRCTWCSRSRCSSSRTSTSPTSSSPPSTPTTPPWSARPRGLAPPHGHLPLRLPPPRRLQRPRLRPLRPRPLLPRAPDGGVAAAAALVLALAYLAGLVYLSVVWHLASVVSVLEDAKGFDAMRKSRALIRGKLRTAAAIFVKLNLCFVGVEVAFRELVVKGRVGGLGARFALAALMLGLLCAVVLFALVVQTVVYFVCKSHHHESIDRGDLADHLEVYLGEYVPLKAKDVQMEQFDL
uniref:Uncharacterized protein n=1 Tax=Ananas comosus var. bracteatus TaxID=296719 RepID=A0A6V7Q7N8_ANACO|nr:unnamed protein product [Ananas comosus var. bracteatus]